LSPDLPAHRLDSTCGRGQGPSAERPHPLRGNAPRAVIRRSPRAATGEPGRLVPGNEAIWPSRKLRRTVVPPSAPDLGDRKWPSVKPSRDVPSDASTPQRTARLMRRFQLHRDHDVTGVSGTGLVAEGAAFSDGGAVVRWLTGTRSTVVWENVEDVNKIHGHGGATRMVWVDPPSEKIVSCLSLEGAVAFELPANPRDGAHPTGNPEDVGAWGCARGSLAARSAAISRSED